MPSCDSADRMALIVGTKDKVMKKIIDIVLEKENEYRPIPFWSWNSQLEESELKRQIEWMEKNAIGGFFMHARSGLKTPYLSEEWMQHIENCCDEAAKRNMKAWAYDENGWPSGFVGGKLLENISDRDMYILHAFGEYDANSDVSYLVGKDELQRVHSGHENGEYLNLYFHHSTSTVDILNPEVTKKFLNMTHQKYAEHFGEAFSEKLEGFFTDEPQYYRWHTSYTPLIRQLFLKEYNEEIFDKLGLLFVAKEGYRDFRYRYWLGMQQLMLTNFAKQIYDWCDEHDVKLTGHYLEEKSLDWQLMCCGGIMPFYEYEHIPGVDWLGAETDNELPAKQVSSVARQLGKKKVLTETFGCCGWDISPANLRRIAGFQMANGVNLVCHHLIPYSEHGQRKRDFPVHFAPINPWIKEHFKEFNTFLTRVGCLLGEGEEVVNVAVLHPIRSAYLKYQREDEENEFGVGELQEGLRMACRTLSSRGISYHFLDETLMEKYGFIEDSLIGCGKCKYQYLVIPKILTMGKKMELLLKQYVQNGGRVLLFDDKPMFLEGKEYSYEYLESNCVLEEIVNAQPFKVENVDTDLYYAYRVVEGEPVLFVQNTSETKEHIQKFDFGKDIHSFTVLEPLAMQTTKNSLQVTIPANGSLVLLPSKEMMQETQQQDVQVVDFKGEFVDFESNYLTLDCARYSKDGIVYSEEKLTYQIFNQLLEDRYEGTIWLQYRFDIHEIPKEIKLLAEKGNGAEFHVNGVKFDFDANCKEEPSLFVKNISSFVREGENIFTVKLLWHQSEETYYALFGDEVTESLKNCIVYDSEIEAVYLSGEFGVYAKDKWDDVDEMSVSTSGFYIGAIPKKVFEPTTDGLPFFRGNLIMSQTVEIQKQNVVLRIPGRYQTANIFVNKKHIGELLFEREKNISEYVVQGFNEIEIEYCIGNRNLLGPLHYMNKEEFVAPDTFEQCDVYDNVSQLPKYKLHRFYKKE